MRKNPVTRKTSGKSGGAKFTQNPQAKGGASVRIGRDGGGTYGPKNCSGNRAHFYQSH